MKDPLRQLRCGRTSAVSRPTAVPQTRVWYDNSLLHIDYISTMLPSRWLCMMNMWALSGLLRLFAGAFDSRKADIDSVLRNHTFCPANASVPLRWLLHLLSFSTHVLLYQTKQSKREARQRRTAHQVGIYLLVIMLPRCRHGPPPLSLPIGWSIRAFVVRSSVRR